MRFLVSCLFFVFSMNVQSASDVRGSSDYGSFERFPRSTIVQYKEIENADYRFVLGGLEKIDGVIAPEKEERLSGKLYQLTYRIPQNHSSEEVFSFFAAQLQEQGATEQFNCQGRACGSSNQWANTIFKYSRLYGLDTTQRVATFKNDQRYFALYSVQRGNKKVYLRLDVLETSSNHTGLNKSELVQAYTDSQEGLEKLLAFIQNNPKQQVWIVSADFSAGSYQEKLNSALEHGNQLKAKLIANGVLAEQVNVHPVGAFGVKPKKGDVTIMIYKEEF
ncbi:DUF4892 domain-containing protein [Neptuniibacter sp. PT34_22]|uniref:DUF4892 domain-containing protein n=1 Tax=Neptuniibacter sp. PT34_22 TaxID=3398205 RepID=UPI0039F61863